MKALVEQAMKDGAVGLSTGLIYQPGVFANRFRAEREQVWTLYNANGRSVRGALLRVPHRPGATYRDAWNGRVIHPQIRDTHAWIALELGPRAVGCVAQQW